MNGELRELVGWQSAGASLESWSLGAGLGMQKVAPKAEQERLTPVVRLPLEAFTVVRSFGAARSRLKSTKVGGALLRRQNEHSFESYEKAYASRFTGIKRTGSKTIGAQSTRQAAVHLVYRAARRIPATRRTGQLREFRLSLLNRSTRSATGDGADIAWVGVGCGRTPRVGENLGTMTMDGRRAICQPMSFSFSSGVLTWQTRVG